jgi:hypothetical protein
MEYWLRCSNRVVGAASGGDEAEPRVSRVWASTDRRSSLPNVDKGARRARLEVAQQQRVHPCCAHTPSESAVTALHGSHLAARNLRIPARLHLTSRTARSPTTPS